MDLKPKKRYIFPNLNALNFKQFVISLLNLKKTLYIDIAGAKNVLL